MTKPDAVAELMARVGERVRKARERRGVSRKTLSEISGVSPRYLAQLEAGDGNISIGLLQRVALALDQKIDALVGDEDPWTSQVLRVAALFRAAPTDLRKTVLELLTTVERPRAKRICLIGLRGAGKSTLGRMAGAALKIPFVELNRTIEDLAGIPVADVMALYGPEGFRTLEAQALQRIIALHDTVIVAVAGGVVGEPETYKNLLAHFHSVWITAAPGEYMPRLRAQGDLRPMAGNPEAMRQLEAILASRTPLYQQAQATVDTTGKTPEISLADLLQTIAREKFLD
ncbi:transcriptional regulator [Rhodoblastus sphagnicola]|uniref:Shikimate kinase n=1 Tax=Rhodoblastus sphagnicola TaxID=333368 RepID=A0A2S6MX46_9HYPH|nr:helix-turn-helix transcriptional regulator [Rhodoblastus sphagnicola]MBB4199266.1 XRE family aerobic/anaerobic benzoate catabolism transcriptional regulator [Rhodoblastus sphagnicola]PPQ26935.1 transcriptional regulator [Rhodoblastus sphagnicola]